LKPYLVKTPKLLQWLFPRRVWAFSRKEPNVYLTFDDGPIPEVTPWVLDQLKTHNAKATFFCIGDNVQKHPEIFKRIIAEGHTIGNHTFNHLNGWHTETSEYVENVLKCEEIFNSEFRIQNSELLFRPPYGKITSKQAKTLQQKGYKIVMWDVLSADFDPSISKEKCLQNVTKNIQPGSVVIFHDSLKAEKNLRYVLPKVLEYLQKNKLVARSIIT
jgi:peptidoglycan-N-acetylglucosamine deacetylase